RRGGDGGSRRWRAAVHVSGQVSPAVVGPPTLGGAFQEPSAPHGSDGMRRPWHGEARLTAGAVQEAQGARPPFLQGGPKPGDVEGSTLCTLTTGPRVCGRRHSAAKRPGGVWPWGPSGMVKVMPPPWQGWEGPRDKGLSDVHADGEPSLARLGRVRRPLMCQHL